MNEKQRQEQFDVFDRYIANERRKYHDTTHDMLKSIIETCEELIKSDF